MRTTVTMSSSKDASASTSKTGQNSVKPDDKSGEQKPQQPQLSALEDDDEFEESYLYRGKLFIILCRVRQKEKL